MAFVFKTALLFWWRIKNNAVICLTNIARGMKMKSKTTVIFLSILFIVSLYGKIFAQQESNINLKDGWKFTTGDNLQYADPAFDDSQWKAISVNQLWEGQGYTDYDGFAWYRIKVIIPSSLKKNSFLKDSLKIFLGKIDDFDQSFINGKIFGSNCQSVPANTTVNDKYKQSDEAPWDRDRLYVLSVNDPRIMWDKENVIAVRVYDHGGGGGIYSGDLYIGMIHLEEYLESDMVTGNPVINKNRVSKSFTLKNVAADFGIKGEFIIKAVNNSNNKIVYEKKNDVDLKPKESKKFSYAFSNNNQSVIVHYTFKFTQSGENLDKEEAIPYTLTPKPFPKPKINGAKVYGERIGKPFQYTIAATGTRPMTFDAVDLPHGLSIDKNTGIITGRVSEKGEYKVTLVAKNKLGTAKRDLKIEIGDQIALTPPMGWNSWNCWAASVNHEKVIAAAKAFKNKGLINHGWTYINIDDGWEVFGPSDKPKRDAEGNILTSEKFPNMKALGDSIHSLGLKFGIYSSPGPLTCGNYTASYQHELQDAKSYASWGIDYLKYDWCSYASIAKNNSLPELKKPYFVMRDALNKVDRDIVFSLCQYGMGNVWEWGDEVRGNLWRTTGDIIDTWQSLSQIGFNQIANAKYAKPGNWNDPDMLIVGWVGWGPNLHRSRLTPDEQYTHISLWCLLSAPLLIGCDLERLDDFTLNLLTNDEVLALDQDPLGKQAVPIIKNGNIQVWVKNLEDGTIAVGIFNLGKDSEKYSLDLKEIGINSKVKIRDLWRQKDLGSFTGKYTSKIPSHGVVLVKIF